MHDIAKYQSPHLMKGDEYGKLYWIVHDKELSEYEIYVATRDELPIVMQDEMDYKENDYSSFPNEEWWDLLSTIESKDDH